MTIYKAQKRKLNASPQDANASTSIISLSTDLKILNVHVSTPTKIMMLPKRHVLVVSVKRSLLAGGALVDSSLVSIRQSVSINRRKRRKERQWATSKEV